MNINIYIYAYIYACIFKYIYLKSQYTATYKGFCWTTNDTLHSTGTGMGLDWCCEPEKVTKPQWEVIPNTEVGDVGALLCRPALSRSQRRQTDGEESAPRVGALGRAGRRGTGKSDWFCKHQGGAMERYGAGETCICYIMNENSSYPSSSEHKCTFSKDTVQRFR